MQQVIGPRPLGGVDRRPLPEIGSRGQVASGALPALVVIGQPSQVGGVSRKHLIEHVGREEGFHGVPVEDQGPVLLKHLMV